MATLALAAVFSWAGGAVGTAIGITWGASAGWLLGSYLGSLLSQPNQVGPRLGEIRVQGSSFGAYLPIIWGKFRLAGQVITLSQINPIDTTSGGKGGGPTVTTESYYQDYAIAIANARTSTGYILVRAWKNGSLIYNVGPGADVATLSQLPSNLKFYPGSATQLPDPTLESHYGVGKVSAYRSTCYVMITQDDVTQTGGRANQYEFEIASVGTMGGSLTWDSAKDLSLQDYTKDVAAYADADGVHVLRLSADGSYGVTRPMSIAYLEHWLIPYTGDPIRIKKRPGGGAQFYVDNFASQIIDAVEHCLAPTKADEVGAGLYLYSAADSAYHVAWLDGDLGLSKLWVVSPDSVSAKHRWMVSMAKLQGHYMAIFWDNDTSKFLLYVDGAVVSFPGSDDGAGTSSSRERPIYISASYFWIVSSYTNGTGTAKIHRYDALGTFVDVTTVPSGVHDYAVVGVLDDDHVIISIFDAGTSHQNWWSYSLSGASYSATALISDTANAHSKDIAADDGLPQYNGAFFPTDHAAITFSGHRPVSGNTSKSTAHRWGSYFTDGTVTDGDIVADLSQEVGLTSGQYNVTALIDPVAGFGLIQLGSARSAIEQLSSGFFFDSADFDGKVNFVKRGGAVIATIPLNDLSGHAPGGEPPDPVTKVRNDAIQLPTRIDVSYINYARDYQVDTQPSEKLTVSNSNPITMSIPIVITETRAKLIADVNMFEAWTSREVFTFHTGWKWQHLTPTDVIQIEGNGIVRIVSKSEAVNGVITWRGVRENPSVYTQSGVGSNSGQSGQYTIASLGPTQMELLDIPNLELALDSNATDDYGIYGVLGSPVAGWRSGTVFKSIDGGTTYNSFFSSSSNGGIGYALTSLADWTSGNIFDPFSVLRVEIDTKATLSSCTYNQLLQNFNVALYGNEVIQYMNATLVSADVYDISGILHGRLGTEWASVGHAIGDRFDVLDSASLRRLGALASEVGQTLLYKPVTGGNTLASASLTSFVNTGVSKKPYAPVLLGYYKDTDGSWWLRWQRRSRVDNQWHAYASEPLGEATEKYEVDFYDSTGVTFKRTYSVTAQTVHYLLADVTTDGTATHFVAKVYQIGALGRGYAGTLTV